MKHLRLFHAALALTFSSVALAADYSTPVAALRALEAAYERKDVEAAVAAKDFLFEARAMLEAMKGTGSADEALVKQAAEVLELSFRQELKERGYPNFVGLKCTVVQQKSLRDGLVEMLEKCVYPDQRTSTEKVHAARSATGWRIVTLP